MTAPRIDLGSVPSAEEWDRPGLGAAGRRTAAAAIEAMLCDVAPSEARAPVAGPRHDAGPPTPPALVAPDSAWVERVVRTYDRSIGAASFQVRLGVRVLVALLEWLPLVVLGEPTRMSRLSLALRVRYLEALEAHPFAPLTMLLVATKVPMLMSAFESGDALRITGFDRETTFARRRLPMTRPVPAREATGSGEGAS